MNNQSLSYLKRILLIKSILFVKRCFDFLSHQVLILFLRFLFRYFYYQFSKGPLLYYLKDLRHFLLHPKATKHLSNNSQQYLAVLRASMFFKSIRSNLEYFLLLIHRLLIILLKSLIYNHYFVFLKDVKLLTLKDFYYF